MNTRAVAALHPHPHSHSLAACAQRTHSSQSGHHEEGRWGAEEGETEEVVGGIGGGGTLQLKGIFFNGSIWAVLKGVRENPICLSIPVSTRRSDKGDFVLTW